MALILRASLRLASDGLMVDPSRVSPEVTSALEQVLTLLPDRERRVLVLRYGLEGGEPQTLEQVGRHGGAWQRPVSRERVRQIQKKAVRKLRHRSRRSLLEPFVLPVGRPDSSTSRDLEVSSIQVKHVVITTDGSCVGNPGPGGYGVVLRYKEHQHELSGGYLRWTPKFGQVAKRESRS